MSVVIETTLGDLTVDLYTEERPQTCKNFLKLCKLKYYNFSLFHTVQANFIAQTGDPTGSGSGGESVFGIVYGADQKYYEAESLPKIKHTKPGLLSMVNCGNNMLGSQFFVTLGSELQSLDEHCVFGEVTEGQDVLLKLNEAVCDFQHKPYREIRITHTVILDDPFKDLPGMQIPPSSPDISQLPASNGRLGADEELGDDLTGGELEEAKAEQEARARATILEIVGDIPHAEIAPPENVLFVCKLNPVTNDEDLETLFSRFGKINSCEVIRDHITRESLQYAFIEFADKKSCEQAYMKMDNVLIDDRRIHVDFSQSVSKIRWKGKGRGVELIEKPEEQPPKLMTDLRYSSTSMMNRGREQQYYRERRGRDDDRRRGREDDTRRRRRDDDDKRRDDRRRDDDRRRRGNDSRRGAADSNLRRHRDYSDSRHSRNVEEMPSDSRHHRRHEDIPSLLDTSTSNNNRSRYDERARMDQTIDFKLSKQMIDRTASVRAPLDNGEQSKNENFKNNNDTALPSKKKLSPQRKPNEEKKSFVVDADVENDLSKNEVLSQSMINSDVSSKLCGESGKKKKIQKSKSRRKRRSSSTSSFSSDSSRSSSTSSSSTTSSSSSSSSPKRIIVKKNGKYKKHRKGGVLTKKYYDHKGKLIKVVKKHRKNDSSSSETSSDSDMDKKRSKKKHRRRKRKNKFVKIIKKSSSKKSTDDEGESETEESGSDDDVMSNKSPKNSDKHSKKRKHSDKMGTSKRKKDNLDKISLNSLQEDDLTELQSPDKKKMKPGPITIKKIIT